MVPRRHVARFMIRKVRRAGTIRRKDFLAVEEPLEIRLAFIEGEQPREQSIAVTMRTPGDDFELTAGFLFTEGIIEGADDIAQMSYCVGPRKAEQGYNVVAVHLRPGVRFDPERLRRNFYTTSSCGVCGKASIEALELAACPVLPVERPVIPSDVIRPLGEKLRDDQSVYRVTGGLHAAGLFDANGQLIDLCEDVGRHNAVDKLIGRQLFHKKIPLHDALMMVSGRASFEILQKALMAGIPIVAAVGAPSSLAVEVAREFGMTLLGFVREGRFNIYAGAQRVRLDRSQTLNEIAG